MNNDERQMIADLFDRMRTVHGLEKDADAEAFIHQSMRENGNSPYLLVQSVLAQEIALQEAGRRIEELEAQVATGSNASRSSAGFTGAVPAGQPAPWEAQPQSSASSSSAARAGAWGAPPSGAAQPSASSARSSGVPVTQRAAAASGLTNSSKPGKSSVPPARTAQAARSGGGFLGQAMTTAAGVAGGMLLASSIGSLFGGGANAAATPTPATETAAADTTQPTTPTETAAADTAQNDQGGFQDASHEENHGGDDWGMDDTGGGDFDI